MYARGAARIVTARRRSEMMSNQHDPNHSALNPYAPSPLVAGLLRSSRTEARRIPTLGLMAATLAGVVLSGAAFGMILAGMISLAEPANLLEFPILLPLGVIVGGVIAVLSGIPTVLVLLCLSAPIVPLSKGWLSHHARHYASVCGFFAGGSPIILVDSGNPYSWLIAVVPGSFGALGTRLFVRWIVADSRRRPVPNAGRTLVEQSGNIVT